MCCATPLSVREARSHFRSAVSMEPWSRKVSGCCPPFQIHCSVVYRGVRFQACQRVAAQVRDLKVQEEEQPFSLVALLVWVSVQLCPELALQYQELAPQYQDLARRCPA
jgi:hypothetical protein